MQQASVLNAHGKPIVHSQPRDTGIGRHWGTQLIYAVNYLKVLLFSTLSTFLFSLLC